MSMDSEMEMGGTRRRSSAPKAGSVWESRMKLDEVKGGVKVFNGATHQENVINSGGEVDKNVQPKQSPSPGVGIASPKRKTWKSEGLIEGSPVQIGRQRSELKESPVQIKKIRSHSRKLGLDEAIDDEDLKNPLSLQLVKVTTAIKNSVENKATDGPKQDLKGKFERSEQEFGICEVKEINSNFHQIQTPSEEQEEEIDKEIEVIENLEIKEISFEEKRPKKFVIEDTQFLHRNERSAPISPLVKKQLPPVVNPNPTKTKPIPVSDQFHEIPRTQNRLQSFVDLIMWRNVSKSALIFGIGTFLIISSSYIKDLNISFISVISYLGLAYLAAIFLFRSFITRGIEGNTIEDCVVGEEEAIWLIKLLLPYVNEFLLKLRALFCGDPSTTMKLAVLLFILARCGSSITIWKLAKLGFLGVFTVPKVFSSYSLQLTAFGTFWMQRFRDAWESCSHKKAIGFAIFTLVWNLSSVVARIWAVFILIVVFKYYRSGRDGSVRQPNVKLLHGKIMVDNHKCFVI